jgi:hypothetical protein
MAGDKYEPFKFYNPVTTFQSQGFEHGEIQKFIGLNDVELPCDVPHVFWSMGLDAYSKLEKPDDIYKLSSDCANDLELATWLIEKLISDGFLRPNGVQMSCREFEEIDIQDRLHLYSSFFYKMCDDEYNLGFFFQNELHYRLVLVCLDQLIPEMDFFDRGVASLNRILTLSQSIERILFLPLLVKDGEKTRKENTSKALNARHKENRELKKEAIEYFEKNQHQFNSRISIAREIAASVVPVTDRTIEKWLAEHTSGKNKK